MKCLFCNEDIHNGSQFCAFCGAQFKELSAEDFERDRLAGPLYIRNHKKTSERETIDQLVDYLLSHVQDFYADFSVIKVNTDCGGVVHPMIRIDMNGYGSLGVLVNKFQAHLLMIKFGPMSQLVQEKENLMKSYRSYEESSMKNLNQGDPFSLFFSWTDGTSAKDKLDKAKQLKIDFTEVDIELFVANEMVSAIKAFCEGSDE